MFQTPLPTDKSVAAPLLSSSEPNDRLPHLTCCPPPPQSLIDLLQPSIPKHLIVDVDASHGITLRHPGDLLDLGTIHTVEDLLYCMDIYQLLSQRKLKRFCLPATAANHDEAPQNASSFLFQYKCCEKDCPFRLCYRRAKYPRAGTTTPNQCELILPSDDESPQHPDEYPHPHKCEPHSAWHVVTDEEATSEENATMTSTRGSGYCASTALIDALVTRYLLLERRHSPQMEHLERYIDPFQQQLGIRLSKERFVHACKLFEQIVRTWPKYVDEDASICDSAHSLWCVGMQTKGLPNTILRFLLAGTRPVTDPTVPFQRTVVLWLWYFAQRVGKCLAFLVFVYTVGLVLALGSGSVFITGAIRGASHWNELVDTMQKSTNVVEFEGWVSDRTQPLSTTTFFGRCMGFIYGRNHGALTLVTYMEDDGADFTRKFVIASRFNAHDLDQVVSVPIKRFSNQWSYAFPSLAFSRKHGLFSRIGYAGFGVFLWAYFYLLVFELQESAIGTIAFALLQVYFFWISWTCTPPEQPWEGIPLSLWSPRGCHDYSSTLARVMVFRVWAMSIPKQLSTNQENGETQALTSNPSLR